MISLQSLVPDDRARYRLLRAISAMKATNDGKIVIDFLKTIADYIDKNNRAAASPQLQWNQGAAQLLEDLDKLIQDAEPLAEKLRASVLAG